MMVGERLREATVVLALPHEPTSVWIARHTLADQLAAQGVSSPDSDDAQLVISELVSNAVKHAAALPNGQIKAGWAVVAQLLYVEVTDGGAGTHPQATVAPLSALGGRGLDLVGTVSSRWGVTDGEGTVTVWAEVSRTRRGEAGQPAA